MFIEPNGMSMGGHQLTAGTDLEGLLGNKDTILLDPLSREVYVNDDGKQREVYLTRTEFNLLEYLMRNDGRVVLYEDIYTNVIGNPNLVGDFKCLVRVHTNGLRKKLCDDANNPIYIANVRSVGYRFIGAQNKG